MAGKALAAVILAGIGSGFGLILAGAFHPAFVDAGLALLLAVAVISLFTPYHDSPPAHPTSGRKSPHD